LPPDVAAAHDPDPIPRQIRRGISWNLIGAISTNLMRLLVLVVLGRVLGSRDFGVVAAALSVITILTTVRDVGIGPALIQRKALEPEHYATAFAVSTYLGFGLAAVVVGTAPAVARLFHSPECVDLLRALSFMFVFRGLSMTSIILFQRAMDFRTIALIDTVTYSIGSLASIGLAVAGLGPWALAAGYLIEEGLSTATFLYLRRPRMTLRIDRARLGDLIGFGAGSTAGAILHMLAIQGDNLVVGHRLGPAQLGFYTRAYDLIKMPALVFTNVVGSVLFPALSRLQGDRAALGAGFRRLIFANALVLLPASAVLIAIAPEVIRILMGPHWDAAVLPFQILAATMMMRVSYKVGSTVATAAGAVYPVALANALYTAGVIGGALVTARWGIPGVAVSTGLSILLMYLLCAWLGLAHSALGWRGFGAAHLPGVILGAAVSLAAWPCALAMRAEGAPTVATFAAIAVLGAVITLGGIALWIRRGRGDFGWLRAELGGVIGKLRGRARAPVPAAPAA
jgi:PST family polysaccharide transporter